MVEGEAGRSFVPQAGSSIGRIREYFGCPKSPDCDALTLQPYGTTRVCGCLLREIVNSAVHLGREAGGSAEEIQHIRPYRMLTTEADTVGIFTQMPP